MVLADPGEADPRQAIRRPGSMSPVVRDADAAGGAADPGSVERLTALRLHRGGAARTSRPLPGASAALRAGSLPTGVVARGGRGFRVQDLAGLVRGAGDALGDEVDEAGDVLQAGRGRGVGAEDAHALPGDPAEVGGGPGARHRGLVQDVVVDDVALATPLVPLAADEPLAVEQG